MAADRYYILKGHTPVMVSMGVWGRWFADMDNRRVAETIISARPHIYVSTVFMGLDHDFMGKGPPLLFETLIFGGPLDGECHRAAFYKQAQRQHDRAVKAVRGALRVKLK